jgi:hypothetical protein
MQLFSRKKALLAAALGALSVLGACGDDVVVTPQDNPVVLSISPPSASLNVGESANFVVQISGGSATTPPTVTACASSNTAVATATLAAPTCRATAVTPGNATITATVSTGQQIAAQVTVSQQNPAITGLTVSPQQANLGVGQTITITPNFNKAAAAVTTTNAFTTSAASVATVSAAGVVTAVGPGVATITTTVTGTGAGFTTTSLSQATTVNVGALPASITSLTVQPTTLPLAIGQTFSFDTATVRRGIVQPAGCAPAVISFGTSAPTVATVNATTGLVTSVGAGPAVITVTATAPANAQCTASTLTQLITVNVSPAATITLAQIRQGPVATVYFDDSASTSTSTSQGQPLLGGGAAGILSFANPQVNQPVDANNVRDQIQITGNLSPNGQRVDSVVVFIADVSATNPNGVNRRAAARQIYSNGQANVGPVELIVNTADFTVDSTAGTANVFYTNGQKIISLSVFTTTPAGAAVEIQNASNNRQTVNFNNLDGYALLFPTTGLRTATNPAVTLNYFGGPGTAGAATFTVIPVFYTPGRMLVTATIGLRQGLFGSIDVCGAINGAVPFSRETFVGNPTLPPPPIRPTINSDFGRNISGGTSTTPSTVGNGIIECGGYEAPQTTAANVPAVVAAIDNSNNPAPRVTFAAGYRFSSAVRQPTNIRFDYAGPSVPEPDIRRLGSTTTGTWAVPAVTGWVNAAFNFNTNTAASTDLGVGIGATSVRQLAYTGCGSATNAFTTAGGVTGNDIPECATDLTGGYNLAGTPTGAYLIATRGPYRARFVEADLLGNSSTGPSSQQFGVDKTAPQIRFSAASSPDTTIGNFIFQAEAIDERAGFIDPTFDNGAKLRSSGGVDILLNTSIHGSQHQFASRGAGVITNTTDRTNCINPNSVTALLNSAGSAISANPFMTAPPCAYLDLAATTMGGGVLPDGYRSAFLVNIGVDGLYRYQTRIFDRAGNVSDVLTRRAGRDVVAPVVTDLNVPITLAAASTPAFQVTASDNVEIRAANTSLSYGSQIPASARLRYPQTLLDARFNDLVNSPNQRDLTVPLPQPFPISLQTTTGAGNLGWTSATAGTNVVDVNAQIFDVANAPATSPTVSFGATSFSAQTGFGNTAGVFTSFTVLPGTAAGFNAGQGLKAQLVSNTEVANQQFARVDFYRLSGGEYQYLGSTTNAAVADQGITRYFTFNLPENQFAGLPTAFETQQPAIANGDNIIAIGVRTNGSGVVTAATIVGSNLASISIPVAGLPSGVSANITLTCTNAGNTVLTQVLTGPATVQVPVGTVCTYTAGNSSPAPGTGLIFTPTPNTQQTVTAGIAGSTTTGTTINYAGGQTLSVVINGIGAAATPIVIVSGPSGNFPLLDDGSVAQLAPGSYAINAVGQITIAGVTYALTGQTATSATVTPTTITPATVTLTYAPVGSFSGASALTAGGPAGGVTLTLTNNATGVATTVTGGTAASGLGGTITLAPGTYTVTAPTVAGFTAPTNTPQTVTITSGATTSLLTTVGYTALGAIQVTSTCSPALVPATPTNCPAGFTNSVTITGPGGFTQTFATGAGTTAALPAGTYTVTNTGDITVNGVVYYASGTQTVTVTNGGGIVVAPVTYTQAGNIQVNVSGLPAGVNANVVLTVQGGSTSVLQGTSTIPNVRPGTVYSIVINDVVVGGVTYKATPNNYIGLTVSSGAATVTNIVYVAQP